MKKTVKLLIISVFTALLLTSCSAVLGKKECSCKSYTDGELVIEQTVELVAGDCSSLNSSTTYYINDNPVKRETKCSEMF